MEKGAPAQHNPGSSWHYHAFNRDSTLAHAPDRARSPRDAPAIWNPRPPGHYGSLKASATQSQGLAALLLQSQQVLRIRWPYTRYVVAALSCSRVASLKPMVHTPAVGGGGREYWLAARRAKYAFPSSLSLVRCIAGKGDGWTSRAVVGGIAGDVVEYGVEQHREKLEERLAALGRRSRTANQQCKDSVTAVGVICTERVQFAFGSRASGVGC
jgi:hypothetical protein